LKHGDFGHDVSLFFFSIPCRFETDNNKFLLLRSVGSRGISGLSPYWPAAYLVR
jgi:hypothetical protein